MSVRLLSIESSCDETSVAIVEDGRRIHANVVASQTALHARTGGIVPEVAARAHLRWMIPVLEAACTGAGVTDLASLDGICVTQGPGLAGSLLVGITMARTLAWDTGLPLVPVNHLEGHIYAAWLLDPGEPEHDAPVFPLVALVVSGGHTFLVEMTDHLHYRLLGQTVDDAAGEAFDKVGRLLGLPYPGGPSIMASAASATRHDRRFPRAWMGDSGDFSFSGLKTAARRAVTAALGPGADAAEPDGSLPADRGGRGAGLGIPGLGGRCARDADRARGCHGRCPDGGHGWRGRRQQCPAGAHRDGRSSPGHPARRAPSGPVHRQWRDDRRCRLSTVRGGGACRARPGGAAVMEAGRAADRAGVRVTGPADPARSTG